jgi:hypothetical protein
MGHQAQAFVRGAEHERRENETHHKTHARKSLERNIAKRRKTHQLLRNVQDAAENWVWKRKPKRNFTIDYSKILRIIISVSKGMKIFAAYRSGV